jgi:hypothetical protein
VPDVGFGAGEVGAVRACFAVAPESGRHLLGHLGVQKLEEVARHLFELLDAQMPEEMAARLRRHCETCPHCSDLASAEAHIRHILRRSCCGEPAPATLRVRITSQIAVYRRTTA